MLTKMEADEIKNVYLAVSSLWVDYPNGAPQSKVAAVLAIGKEAANRQIKKALEFGCIIDLNKTPRKPSRLIPNYKYHEKVKQL